MKQDDSQRGLMKYPLLICAALVVAMTASQAQMSSHAPSTVAKTTAASTQVAAPPAVTDKAVATVNGAVLTDRDLLREMYTIFPYAQQHNGGFPKDQESSIRQGALQMIIFEELVYQEGVRRKLAVSPERLTSAAAEFRKQFKSPDEYQQYMQVEMHGSEKQLREKIRRSMLIEQVLKSDVEDRSAVSLAEVKAYYEKNSARFEQPETFTFQSISIMPPLKPTADQAKVAQKKAEDAARQAKGTKSYEEFGLLAEKISEDDFRVNLGDHKVVGRDKLPPQVVKALLAIKPGQVTDAIQIESAYTIIRLNAHGAPKKKTLEEVKAALKIDLQKNKYEKLRSSLDKQLRAKAKIEVS
jgi:peptidyl-prolyl cis-trans isomerase SurA